MRTELGAFNSALRELDRATQDLAAKNIALQTAQQERQDAQTRRQAAVAVVATARQALQDALVAGDNT